MTDAALQDKYLSLLLSITFVSIRIYDLCDNDFNVTKFKLRLIMKCLSCQERFSQKRGKYAVTSNEKTY